MEAVDCNDVQDQSKEVELSELIESLEQKVFELEQETELLRRDLDEARNGPYRRRMPDTRESITHKFKIGEHEGYMTVGMHEDGTPGEVFLRMAKEGSTIGGLMDVIGILTSLALQYGVPVSALVRKFEYVRFEPSGWTGNSNMRHASSVVDYIFRWLGMQFSETSRERIEEDGMESGTEAADAGCHERMVP